MTPGSCRVVSLPLIWTVDCVSGHDELLNFRNEEDEDDEDEDDDDEVDDENDEDVGLEYLQKPVDELEVCERHLVAVVSVSSRTQP